jgi:flagellin-specific chaperone FliS
MQRRLFLSLGALLFAGGVLVISLASATQVASTGEKLSAERKLYFNRTLLPDHPLYPVLMAVDRVQLETASSHERIFMEVEYAHRRLSAAEELLDQDKPGLALTTLTKAEKYLGQSVAEAKELDTPDSIRQRLAKAVEYHLKRLQTLQPLFNDADRVIVEKMIHENESLLKDLSPQQ